MWYSSKIIAYQVKNIIEIENYIKKRVEEDDCFEILFYLMRREFESPSISCKK